MAISFLKKGAPASVKAPVNHASVNDDDDKVDQSPPEENEEPVHKPHHPTYSGGTSKPQKGLSFLKRGKIAQQIAAQEDKKAEMRSKDMLYRFWIPPEGSGCITFLDGDVQDGVLDIPFYHEHQVYMNGNWKNWFICVQDDEPCPICAGGSSASYVGILTVIDHGEYNSKKDGTLKKDVIRPFIAKRDTIKLLQKYAVKRGGLRGCTFDVARTGEKSPGVGSSFDFVEKLSEKELVAKWKPKTPKDIDRSKPINYDEYLKGQYQSASELRKLGFGSSLAPIGGEPNPEDHDYNL